VSITCQNILHHCFVYFLRARIVSDYFANLTPLQSRPAIKKYIQANNKIPAVSSAAFDSQFNKAIRTGVDKGDFEQPKGMFYICSISCALSSFNYNVQYSLLYLLLSWICCCLPIEFLLLSPVLPIREECSFSCHRHIERLCLTCTYRLFGHHQACKEDCIREACY